MKIQSEIAIIPPRNRVRLFPPFPKDYIKHALNLVKRHGIRQHRIERNRAHVFIFGTEKQAKKFVWALGILL